MNLSNVSNAESAKKNQRFTALIFLIRIWILIGINFQIDGSKIGFYIITCTISVNFFYKKLKLFLTKIEASEITFAFDPL